MTDRLGSLAREHGTVLGTLGRLGPAVRNVTDRALAALMPVLQQVADQLRKKRRHAVERQHEQERAARPSRGPGLGM